MIPYEDLMLQRPERPSDEQLVENVRELLNRLQGEFVDYLGPVEHTTRSRLLRIYEMWKQINLRRIFDLATAAHEMFRQDRLVPGCTLTRSVFETVGIQYYIYKKMVEYTRNSDPESIHNLLLSAVFGRRDNKDWPEKPIQVLTAIDHMTKEFSGAREEYDHLCEYAHPNMWGGCTYARQEGEKLESHFGRNPQRLDMSTWGLGSLQLILLLAAEMNNRLCIFHQEFVAMAEKHAPNRPLRI